VRPLLSCQWDYFTTLIVIVLEVLRSEFKIIFCSLTPSSIMMAAVQGLASLRYGQTIGTTFNILGWRGHHMSMLIIHQTSMFE
jgi:hypothetical protein